MHAQVRRQASLMLLIRILACVLLTWPALGCGKRLPRICPGIVRVSQNGTNFYLQSQDQYIRIRAADLQGKALDSEMEKAVRFMDAALVNDPRSPLFHSKMGQLLLETDSMDLAKQHFEQARKICEDWVPAWLGLAEIARRQSDMDTARANIKGAEFAIDMVQGAVPLDQPNILNALGLNIAPPANGGPRDPALDENARLQLVLIWLQESEAWTLENPALLTPAGMGMHLNTGSVIRRVRARVEYQKVLVERLATQDPQPLIQGLDRALEWDPDFFPAKVEKAILFRAMGRFSEAERLLRPYVDSADPKLANNGRLLYEVASLYTDWFAEDPKPEQADRADEYFDRLQKVNPEHGPGYLKRAELYLRAGVALRRLDTLAAAEDCLARAQGSLDEQELARSKQLKQEIAQARSKLEQGAAKP